MGFKYLVRDQEVEGSNPFAPTIFPRKRIVFSVFTAVAIPEKFYARGASQFPTDRFVS